MLSQREQFVITQLKQLNVVAKIISASPDDSRCLDHILNQLAKPSIYRPIKKIEKMYRHRFYDPRDGIWYYRSIEDKNRGMPKDTIYTKKNSVTLMTADGQIDLFHPKHGHAVGLMFDINSCYLKNEKYIFKKNANIDKKWWLKQKGVAEREQEVKRAISLLELRNYLIDARQQGKIPEWNELAIGLSKESLIGVFATEDELTARLKALNVKYEVEKQLAIVLPIFVITSSSGIKTYDATWQFYDIKTALHWDSFALPKKFCNLLFEHFLISHPQYQQQPKLESHKENKLMELNTISHFFLAEKMLSELKIHVLSYLSVTELLRLQHIFNNRLPIMTQLIQTAIDHIKLAEIIKILYSLRREHLYNESYFLKIEQDILPYAKTIAMNEIVFKAILESMNDSNNKSWFEEHHELIVRTLGHIYSNKELAKRFLQATLNNNYYQIAITLVDIGISPFTRLATWNLFYNLIKISPIEKLKSLNYKDIQYNELISEANLFYYEEGVQNIVEKVTLCPLLIAALYRDEPIVNFLAKKYPNEVVKALNEFKKIAAAFTNNSQLKFACGEYKFELNNAIYYLPGTKNHIGKEDIDTNLIKKAYIKLLLQLKPSSHKTYILNYSEKRMLEAYLLNQIKTLESAENVNTFWQKHKDALYMNQRRHNVFDRFFRSKEHMPRIKKNIQLAIKAKNKELTQNELIYLASSKI